MKLLTVWQERSASVRIQSRNRKIGLWTLGILLLPLLAIPHSMIPGENDVRDVVLLCTWVALIYCLMLVCDNIFALRQKHKALKSLLVSCNPFLFLKLTKKYLVSDLRIENRESTMILVGRALSLNEICRKDQALETMQLIEAYRALSLSEELRNELSLYLVLLKFELQGPEMSLQYLKNVDMEQGCSTFEEQSEALSEWRLFLGAVLNEDHEIVISSCDKVFRNSTNNMFLRVKAAYCLASSYYGTGNVAAEKECLEFVLEHGGKLGMIAEAEKNISKMQERRDPSYA